MPDKVPCYSGKKLYLRMDEDGKNTLRNSCSFFHEFGHALDDLLLEDYKNEDGIKIINISSEYRDAILDDFKEHMQNAVMSLGYGEMTPDKEEVLQFFMTQTNANVSSNDDPDYYQKHLPDGWSDEQIKLFTDLRSYYGYNEYIYLETGKKAYKMSGHEGVVIDLSKETDVSADLIGAITNAKIGMGSGHFLDPNKPLNYGKTPNDRESIKSIEDVYEVLTNDSYWCKHQKGPIWFDGSIGGAEFFAESFDDRIHEVDQTRNKEVFPTAIDMFEEDIDDAIHGNN